MAESVGLTEQLYMRLTDKLLWVQISSSVHLSVEKLWYILDSLSLSMSILVVAGHDAWLRMTNLDMTPSPLNIPGDATFTLHIHNGRMVMIMMTIRLWWRKCGCSSPRSRDTEDVEIKFLCAENSVLSFFFLPVRPGLGLSIVMWCFAHE